MELVVAMAIGAIMSLAMATVFTFSAEQFASLIDQNDTEESLLLASYYLRATIAQAVKTAATFGDPSVLGVYDGTTQDNTITPLNVVKGYFDLSKVCKDAVGVRCKSMYNTAPNIIWVPDTVNALALFVRENGGDGPNPNNPTSDYTPTGIFYNPPATIQALPNGSMGTIYIAQAPAVTGNFTVTVAGLNSQLKFDHIVAFGLVDSATGPPYTTFAPASTVGPPPVVMNYTAVGAVNLYIRARYFKPTSNVKNYAADPAVAAAAGSLFRDIETNVNIGLRDNVLGPSLLGPAGSVERLTSGLYFYRFAGPQMTNF